MIQGIKYEKYQGHEELINEYYDELFFFRGNKVVDVLRGYCELKGNAINDYMRCHFAAEFPDKNDEEYFGENGVVFYMDSPAVDENCIILLTYDEFFDVVKERYKEYIKDNQEKQEEVLLLLEDLKKSIKL